MLKLGRYRPWKAVSSHFHTPVRPMLLHRPSFLFNCFVKIWATCKNVLGKWFTAPLWQKIARTPMSPAAKSGEKKLFSQARIWSLGIQLQEGSPTLYIWQSKWVGIIAIRTERTQIHFLSDVIVAVGSYQTLIIAHDHPRDHPRTYTVYQGARHSTRSNARN